MKRIYWDIETAPLPESELLLQMPEFTAPGNLKDPDKIKAALETKRQEWLDSAALRAVTGRIVAVTIAENDEEPIFLAVDEPKMIEELVHTLSRCGSAYSWNGEGFDLPFVCQRGAVHGIPAFGYLTTCSRGRRYWNENLVDAMTAWNMSKGHVQGSSLKSVAQALGVGTKSDDGKRFGEVLREDPVRAKEYALNDVRLLRAVVNRMGI